MGTQTKLRQETIEAAGSLREVVILYPETVSAAHREIERLKDLLVGVRETVAEKEGEIDSLQRQIDDLEEEADDDQAAADDGLVDQVNAFLDECERVGVRRYRVPDTDRANTAIVALHDLAGRNP